MTTVCFRSRALALLAAFACTPSSGPASVGGRFSLGFDGEVFAVRRDDVEVLGLPLGGIALGDVPAYDETRSYDPFYLDDVTDEGVDWRVATGVAGSWPAYTLTFDGGGSAVLALREVGEGRFGLALLPVDAPLTGAVPALVRLTFTVDPEEGLYGLGSALDTPNRRGSVRAAQLEIDPTTEAFSNEAHVHVPFALGTTGWGLLARDDHPATFDFGAAQADELVVTIGTGPDTLDGLAFDLYVADHPLDVPARMWAATGGHALPAPWALGPLVWRDENDDQAQVEADLRAMRDLDLAASAVWIDRPYASGVNTFDFDPAKFPDPAAMVDLAHGLGFRMSLWHTPYVDEEEAAALYAEAEANGWFAPEHPPVFIDWSSPVDLSNPDAAAWWQANLGAYADLGIEGYKLDYAEEILLGAFGGRLAWAFANGEDERTMHGGYQRYYHRAYAEMLPDDGGFLLVRTGVWGDQVHAPIVWPGDLDATMARWGEPATDRDGGSYVSVGGLPASLVDALSLGASGWPFYGSDTGGYRHSPPDNETFVRWFEQTAASSVMQIGTSSNDVAWEPTPENGFDADTLTWYRTYTRFHLRLWPYLWTYAQQIAEGRGRPLMRALGLAFPELGVHPGDTYLLGDSLLAAPVVVRGARARDVTFPPGRWIDTFRGDVHGEGTATVDAPLEVLPLYLRAGGIVPMLRPTIDTLSPSTDPGVDSYVNEPGPLWARVFPGDPGAPGTTFAVFDGAEVGQVVDADGAVHVTWTPGSTFTDVLVVELIGTPSPDAVTAGGAALPPVDDPADVTVGTWAWTDDIGGTLTIALGPDTGEVVAE